MDTIVKTRTKRNIFMPTNEKKLPENMNRKRIPISQIYFKKGDYEELVDDPFNLKS